MPQKPIQLELAYESPSEAQGGVGSVEAPTAARESERPGSALMVRVLERSNLQAALKRVKQNKGSPGVDGMKVEELSEHLRVHWPRLREQLFSGTYQPQPVKRVAIPKEGGGTRELGIPTVLDRFIQQAVLQILQREVDPTFSEHSHGFRPGRSAHGAIRKARSYVQAGRQWVVDVDLEKFFDRVNHDILMNRIAKHVADKQLLKLIRGYLEAGLMANGVVMERHEGTPQGGPLSPLLANVLLDEVDKELENRGHAFVRYADDCNVYVQSKRAGERVMTALREKYASLRLRINEAKSTVARVEERKFLGFSFWVNREGGVQIRVAPQAMERLKNRVRMLTRRAGGQSLRSVCAALRAYLTGWKAYFRLTEGPKPLKLADAWIRRRLRALQMSQWRTAGRTRTVLRGRGCPEHLVEQVALMVGSRRWWYGSDGHVHVVLPNAYFDQLGLPRLFEPTSTR